MRFHIRCGTDSTSMNLSEELFRWRKKPSISSPDAAAVFVRPLHLCCSAAFILISSPSDRWPDAGWRGFDRGFLFGTVDCDARAQRGRERWVLSGGRDESEEKKLASGERKSAGWRIWRRKLDGYQALEDKVERARYRAQAQRAGDNKDDYLNVRFPQVTNAVKWPPLPHNQLQQTDTGL